MKVTQVLSWQSAVFLEWFSINSVKNIIRDLCDIERISGRWLFTAIAASAKQEQYQYRRKDKSDCFFILTVLLSIKNYDPPGSLSSQYDFVADNPCISRLYSLAFGN